MRSMNEQLQEVLKRSDAVRKGRAVRRRVMSTAVGACICLALLIVAGLYLPALSAAQTDNGAAQYGSLLLTTSNMGYVVIGVLAFLLGIFVALLCLYVKKHTEMKRS